ncbi:MAG TPA: DUF2975 domain-containing protein [Acidimicrobiales bacterium]|nr:DUF2975 domain-containing protein [Acidimicrobiales bacterium]
MTLLLALVVAFLIALVGVSIDGALHRDHRVVVHQTAPVDRIRALPPEVRVPVTVPVTLRIDDASTNQLALALARDLGPIALVLGGLWLLRGLLRSVRDGDPFTTTNVRRLRTMGLLLAVGAPVVTIVTSALSSALAASTSSARDLSSPLALSWSGPLAGLGVFVLAEVFARGSRMRDDIEGTV